jgi:hypothetical protein
MWLYISFAGYDNGEHVYLIYSDNAPSIEYAISVTSSKPIPRKVKESFFAVLDMECFSTYRLINDDKARRYGDWGTPAKAYTCTADRIGVDGIVYEPLKVKDK